MLWTGSRFAALRSPSVLVVLLAGTLPVDAAAPGAFPALEARSQPVQRVAPAAPPAAAPAADDPLPRVQDCPTGQVDRCFEFPSGSRDFVNVATFFDKAQRTQGDDFMVKLFVPPNNGRNRLNGFVFECNRAGPRFPAAGAVVTSATEPIFPTNEQLQLLQQGAFEGAAAGTPTCVDLTGSSLILESGQAAWLIVHCSADTPNVYLRADRDPTDHPCDFMTRDAGDYWYRPDPRQSPYDWEFTPYFDVLPAKQQDFVWSQVKSLYR
jgi:hypothetical protein